MSLRPLYLDTTAGRPRSSADADVLRFGKLELAGVSGVAIDAGSTRLVNLAAPTSGNDAATKTYVDSKLQGFHVKEPVRAASTANVGLAGTAPTTLDGVTLAVNDRVLVKNQTTGSENGIYYVQTLGTGANGTWARAADADTSAEVTSGMYVFVQEGTTNADSAWVLTTDGTITLGTTSLAFTQFSGLGQIVAGQGLTKSGNQIDVVAGNGITVGADSVGVAVVSTGGLEFSSSQLQVKVDAAGAIIRDGTSGALKLQLETTNPGVAITSNKLDVKLSSTGGLAKDANGVKVVSATADQISVDASGLSVTGVPINFKVNGVATGAGVTAANLNELTGGGSTNLHSHSMQATSSLLAGEAIAKGDAVYIKSDGKVWKASNATDTESQVVGVATANAALNANVTIQMAGFNGTALGGGTFTAGSPIYLGTAGALSTYASLASGARIVLIGYTDDGFGLALRIQDFGTKP